MPGECHNLVLFDFDGTVYNGQSPVMLVIEMHRQGLLRTRRALRILAWGIRYKVGLPHDESEVRELIFSGFRNRSADECDEFMRNLYRKKIRPDIRPEAVEAIRMHKAQGDAVVFVSASFPPILECAMEDTGADAAESTIMEIVDGRYTGKTIGQPVEGEEKVRRVHLAAKRLFGDEPYRVTYAYADHYSDVPMMRLAEHPVATTPSTRLRSVCEAEGWTIVDWQ